MKVHLYRVEETSRVLIYMMGYSTESPLYSLQARSQAEARKPGLQHHIGLDIGNPDFAACEQQVCRPACASAQSDQHPCYSLSESKVRSDITKFSIFNHQHDKVSGYTPGIGHDLLLCLPSMTFSRKLATVPCPPAAASSCGVR